MAPVPARTQVAEPYWLYCLAGALMLGGPVWHYLYVNRYPFNRPEAVILPLGSALLGAIIVALGRRAGGLGSSFVFGMVLYLFLDLQLNLETSVGTAAIVAGCLVVSFLLKNHRAALVCVTLAAFDLASLPRPSWDFVPSRDGIPKETKAGLPPILHIVLDEQWGIGGLRAAGDSATAAFLSDFYSRRGFEVYEGAYSHWNWTALSIPDVLSLGQRSDLRRPPPKGFPVFRYRLSSNPYFARLRQLGYAIRVYQTTDLDYCHPTDAVIASCATWPANSIANIAVQQGPWQSRALLAGRFFLNDASHVYRKLMHPPDDPVWRLSVSGGAMDALRTLRRDIAKGVEGTAFFVHVLLPHRPLELEADCRPYANAGARVGNNLPPQLDDSVWRTIIARYSAQDRCAHREIEAVLDVLERSAGPDGAIVIVHGDHGSRLVQTDPGDAPASALDARQLNGIYSTLLAIRRPGMRGGIYTEAVPLQNFLWALIGNDFEGEVRGNWEHYVHHVPDGLSAPVDPPRALSASDMLWASAGKR